MAIVIRYELTGTEVLTRMQVVNAIKDALLKLGIFWWQTFLPKHFTDEGDIEYGFRDRSTRYRQYKLKHLGHQLPLVLSGEGRAEALSVTTAHRIRATRNKVTIPLPRKFNLSNPRGPKMSEEIRAVSKAELRVLEQQLVDLIETELNAAVPPNKRNRGFTGGQVRSLRLSSYRPPRSRAPAALAAAA